MPQRLTKGWHMVESGAWLHEDTQWMVNRVETGRNKGYYSLSKAMVDDFTTHTISGETVYCHTLIEAQRLVLQLTKWWPKDMRSK